MGASAQNALDAPDSGFDTATLVVDGRESRWSAEQFRNMPLLDRIRVLAGGHVLFFRNGTEVPAREALRGL
jgi:hypothetical protein